MLRPYQKKLFEDTRVAFRGKRSVLMQLPTGGGKTYIFAKMTESALRLGRRIWIVVPRNELLQQASDTLARINVPHGRIAAGINESLAYQVHVVSKDTLIRRYDKIKKEPDLIIVDEAHLALDRYIEIANRFSSARILGVTATPERLDGRGLSELYETLVMGPTLQELIEFGFLTNMKYFSPPIEGLSEVHRRGTEFNPDELEALLERRKVYGKAIDHYQRHADSRACLVFCRSIKAADETAQRFCNAGYRFENIDGTMRYTKRRALIDALRDGKIHGLTSCELITYGLDVPRVECIIMLRPTLSRTLYMQMIGRGLRPYPDKSECVVLDHVCNLQEHGHPLAPYGWQFNGTEKRGKRKSHDDITARLCPEIDFLYCEKRSCIGCEHYRGGPRGRESYEVDVELQETPAPVRMARRPFDEKRKFVDKIGQLVDDFWHGEAEGEIRPGPIGELLTVAAALGRQPMWVYHELTRDQIAVNIPLLHEIARQKKYKAGWVYFQIKQLKQEKTA
jgi:superfamily II DNA or RNA helicase